MSPTFCGRTAIAGIGATEFSKESGRSELQLAVEAAAAAINDAGLVPSDVDGFVTYTLDGSPEVDLARCLGVGELRFVSRTPYGGGGACATVQHAAMAVSSGVAEAVVCYRAFNERSGVRFGRGVRPEPVGATVPAEAARRSFYRPFGLATPAGPSAMVARRYMHDFGATSEDFGRVAVAMRRAAATNPKAWFHGRPITLEDHQSSRWVVEPLRLLDCCQESDGGVAVLVTSLERARDLRRPPAVIAAAAQGSADGQESMTSFYRPSISASPELEVAARELWRMSGIGPEDVDVAVLYDHFTPFVLMQLEALGFCGRGEAAAFVADGSIELEGVLPVNPHGGQLGEAYIHGMNGMNEAVRQIRGAAANQIKDVQRVLVTAATGTPTSALVLARDTGGAR